MNTILQGFYTDIAYESEINKWNIHAMGIDTGEEFEDNGNTIEEAFENITKMIIDHYDSLNEDGKLDKDCNKIIISCGMTVDKESPEKVTDTYNRLISDIKERIYEYDKRIKELENLNKKEQKKIYSSNYDGYYIVTSSGSYIL